MAGLNLSHVLFIKTLLLSLKLQEFLFKTVHTVLKDELIIPNITFKLIRNCCHLIYCNFIYVCSCFSKLLHQLPIFLEKSRGER